MVIRQEKSLTSDPQMYLSFEDGMSSYTYKRRLPPNTILYKNRKFSYFRCYFRPCYEPRLQRRREKSGLMVSCDTTTKLTKGL